MKILRTCGLLLLVSVLTAGGALLPYAVSRIQDRYVENQTEARSFEPVSLTLSEDGGLLLMLENMQQCMGMSWQGDTHLTESEIAAAARDTVSALTDAGLIQVYAQRYLLNRELLEEMDLERLEDLCDIYPMLMVSTTNADFSAVAWACHWHIGFEGLFILDDINGKVVSGSIDLSESDYPVFGRTGYIDMEAFTKLAYSWQDFFAVYYEMEAISVSESHSRETSDYTLKFTLLFVPGNGHDSFKVPLVFYDNGYFTFNQFF